MKGANDREWVFERLQELEGGSAHIFEAFHWDQRTEPVKGAMLEQGIELEVLWDSREFSWSLRDKLHKTTAELEYTPPATLAIASPK